MVSKRGVLLVRQVLQPVGVIRLAVLRVPLLVLARQEEADDLGREEADDEADHDACETAVVPRSVGAVVSQGLADCSLRFVQAGGHLRIKHERANDVTDRVGDKGGGRVDGLLGVAGDVRRAEADALHPTGREEVDQVVPHDAARRVGRGELPPVGESLVSSNTSETNRQ